jgi:hypothetical protein
VVSEIKRTRRRKSVNMPNPLDQQFKSNLPSDEQTYGFAQ